MKNFIKFQSGLLIGTLIGAVISSVVCVLSFGALGMELENIEVVQKCLFSELDERINSNS